MTTTDLRDYEPGEHGAVVTIGTFDGLHLGHQSIVHRTSRFGREHRLRSCVITFEPHPQTVLNLHRQPRVQLLTTRQEKERLLEAWGIDLLVILHFDRTLAEMSGPEFVEQILIRKLRMKHCIFGHDHAFGRDRSGTFETLQALGKQLEFSVERAPALVIENQIVKSSIIRRMLMDGNVRAANRFLGYPYRIFGRVVKGDGRGRSIGFPTINLAPYDHHKLVPPRGVYATTITVGNRSFMSVTNIGTRPTFSNDEMIVVETHIPEFSGELYDQDVELYFYEFLRPEKRFSDAGELIRQIRLDINNTLSASFTVD